MVLAEETEMTESEINEVLSRHETGVLAIARADEPYAIPISYGYNADGQTFYLRLVSLPESEKRAFLDSSPEARLVVYEEVRGEETEATEIYRSIVATGSLEEIDPADLTVEHIEQYGEAKRPLFEIWGRSKQDLDIKLYELEPETLSGRRTSVDRSG